MVEVAALDRERHDALVAQLAAVARVRRDEVALRDVVTGDEVGDSATEEIANCIAPGPRVRRRPSGLEDRAEIVDESRDLELGIVG